jgi:hypothetical protein
MAQYEAEQAAAVATLQGFLATLNKYWSGTPATPADFDALISKTWDTETKPTFVGAAGTSTGTTEISDRFYKTFATRFKKANVQMTVNSVQMHGANVAVISGSCIARDVVTLAGDPVPEFKSNSITNLMNKNGKWVITSQSITNETAKIPAAPQKTAS